MDFAEFIREYGYLAVFFGAMIEGESVVLTASALAACGYMSIYKIFVISCITTIFADQGLFWLGHRMGTEWIVKRFPKVASVRDRVFSLLKKFDIAFIFSFRFIYGIRIASPLIIGAARLSPIRFSVCNALAGIVWAIISCTAGYKIAKLCGIEKFSATKAFMLIASIVVLFSFIVGLVIKRVHKKSTDD